MRSFSNRTRLMSACLVCIGVGLHAETNWVHLTGRSLGSNSFELELNGEPETVLSLEVSTNLQHWGWLTTVTNKTGQVTVTDNEAALASRKYYRALILGGLGYQIAEAYCSRARVVNAAARASIHQFVDGLASLGLLTNLADFAFFCAGQNTTNGLPVSWQSEGAVVGRINRLNGGFELPNYAATNWFYFTNLPPTPAGRTLVWWGCGNARPGSILQDAGECMAELTSGGDYLQSTVLSLLSANGGYGPYTYNGVQERIGPSWYGPSGVTANNGVFCAGFSCSGDGSEICLKVDYPYRLLHYAESDPFTAAPTVIRFGIRSDAGAGAQQPRTASWPGLVRGFAYFNRVLTTNEVVLVDWLVPRVGWIVEGDSKSVPGRWLEWACQGQQVWGLHSIVTNDALSGSRVAAANALGNSMEDRWPLVAPFRTNAQFPIILYGLRGGHNDFLNTNLATTVTISNAFKAITNLWHAARTNGFRVVGWTVDRTSVTWSGGTPGNSNLLMQLNGDLRAHAAGCDYLVDIEQYYVGRYGETPWTLSSLYYPDGVHDMPASAEVGTNAVAGSAGVTLGYEGE